MSTQALYAAVVASQRRTRGEGSVSFDPARQRWIGRVWFDGKRHQVSAKSKEECARKLGGLIHGEPAKRRADRKATVGRILAEWAESSLPNRSLAPATRDAYSWGVNAWSEVLGRRAAANLGVEDVERALGRLQRQRGLSKASLVKLRSVLNQAMTWAVRRGTIAKNPVDGCELPVKTTAARDLHAFSQAELRKLLDAARASPRHAMYVLMATVGLRPGEAAGVCGDAIDLATGVLIVRRAVQLQAGRPTLTDHLKTTSAYRTIALPPSAVDALRRVSGLGSSSDALLFPADDGGPLWPSTVRAELADLGVNVGIGKIRPNELRHSASTLLADQLPLEAVADILGHTSTKMLERHYRHRPAVIATVEVL